MYRHIVKIYFYLISLFLTANANGQSFTATVDPQIVGKNGYVTVRYEIENLNATAFSAPSFTNFEIISGPNQENGMSSVNGAVTRYVALSYVLRPKSIGSFNIPPASVIANGKSLKCNSVAISVTKAVRGQSNSAPSNPMNAFEDMLPRQKAIDISEFVLRPGENVAKKVQNNLILKVNVSKDEVYVGEPILASYEFYSRLKSDSKITKNPSFNSFSVIDMQVNENASTVILNGKEYTKNVLRKVQLYPQLPGDIPLETVSVDNDIIFFTEDAANRYSIQDLNSGFGVDPSAILTEHVMLSSQPKTIKVKPLPEKGKPAFFHGAVGSFQITASVDNNKFSTDEAGVLKVTILGSGNLQLITAPEINWPAGIDAFEPALTEQINKEAIPINGIKTFTYNFNISNAGSYKIPEILFAFFDPETGQYKIDKSLSIPFTVTKGNKPTKKSSNMTALNNGNYFWYYVAGGLLILATLIAAIFFSKRKKHTIEPIHTAEFVKTVRAEPIIDEYRSSNANPLAASHEYLSNNDQGNFYSSLNLELRAFLAKQFNLPVNELQVSALQQRCDNFEVNNALFLSLQSLMEKIALNVYSPMHTEQAMQDTYDETAELIEQIRYKCREW